MIWADRFAAAFALGVLVMFIGPWTLEGLLSLYNLVLALQATGIIVGPAWLGLRLLDFALGGHNWRRRRRLL